MSRSGRTPDLRLGEGPGVAYATQQSTSAVRPRSAATVIGTSPRFPRGEIPATPAPSAYNVSYEAVLPASSRVATMGRSSRVPGSPNQVPGPGSYAVEKLDAVGSLSQVGGKANSPRASMGKSKRDGGESSTLTPGPAYSPNVNFVLPSPSGYSMPRGPRGDFGPSHTSESPGPQDYQGSNGPNAVVFPQSPQVKIGTAQRFSEGRDDPPPGPGQYFSAEGLVPALHNM